MFIYTGIFYIEISKYKDSFQLIKTEKITDIDIISADGKTVKYIENNEVKEIEVDNTYIDNETYVVKSTYKDLFLTVDVYDLYATKDIYK